MLVVDAHTLETIDVLDFLGQVDSQGLDAEQAQDVMRIRLAVNDGLALLDMLTLEDDDLTPFRDQLLVLAAVLVTDDQALLALGVLAEGDHARTFGEDRRLFRLARLEQVGDAR